jgi:hypothetical protein
MIGFGYRIGADLVLSLDRTGREAVQNRARLFEGGVNAFESLFARS